MRGARGSTRDKNGPRQRVEVVDGMDSMDGAIFKAGPTARL
jgi:hypothetical protein